METRTFGGIILAVLVVVVLMYARAGGKSAAEERVRDQAMALLQKLPDFGAYEGLYTSLVDAHHRAAFERNSQIGGSSRRTRLTVDTEGHLNELFWEMTVDASRQGYTKQAERLRDIRPQPESKKRR